MKGLKVLLVLGCTAVRAGLLRSVGHGQQDLEDELIHWATGGWHDWDSHHGVLQQEGGEAPESIDQRLKEIHDARSKSGLLATLQVEGMSYRALSQKQLLEIQTEIGRALDWPMPLITDIDVTVDQACDNIRLRKVNVDAGDGSLSDDLDDPRLGTYLRVPSVSSRPVYKQVCSPYQPCARWFLYFGATMRRAAGDGDAGDDAPGAVTHYGATKRWWAAGPRMGSDDAGFVARENVASPELASAWYAYRPHGPEDKTYAHAEVGVDAGWRRAPLVTAECRGYRASISFRAAPQRCNAAEIAQLERLPTRLATHVRGLKAPLISLGAGSFIRSVKILQMRVATCQPRIYLALPNTQEQKRRIESRWRRDCDARLKHKTMRHWGCARSSLDAWMHQEVMRTARGSGRRVRLIDSFNRDCIVGRWLRVGACSVTCGHGRAPYERAIVSEPLGKGKPCPSTKMTRSCSDINICPRGVGLTPESVEPAVPSTGDTSPDDSTTGKRAGDAGAAAIDSVLQGDLTPVGVHAAEGP